MATIIGEKETRRLIDMPRAVALVDEMFRDRAAGKTRSIPRRRLKGTDKQLNVMASWHAGADLLCLRVEHDYALQRPHRRDPRHRQRRLLEQPADRSGERGRREILIAG